MLLICPQCRSGLQVPDDTTALVRCPACKTVFSPTDSSAPEEEEENEKPPKAKNRKPAREEEDEKPRKKQPRRTNAREEEDEEDEEKPENRDFDPVTEEEDRARRRKKRSKDEFAGLSPEEKAARRAAFERATWGCRLIWISFALFLLSMFMIILYNFQSTFKIITPAYLIIAGLLGLFNWLLAAIGVGLCLSGPRSPGHWGYGIAAAVAVVIHGVFLLASVMHTNEGINGRRDIEGTSKIHLRWWRVATSLDSTMFYMLALAYPSNQGIAPGHQQPLPMITGVFEMIRTVLIMMLLSCLARAALDEELAHKCTRASGVASIAPALVAFLILIVFSFLIETNADLNLFTLILINTVVMGTYAIMMGVIFPSFRAAVEVADACDEPFQSLIPQL